MRTGLYMCYSQCLNGNIRPIAGKRATKSLCVLPDSTYKKSVFNRLMNCVSELLSINGQNITDFIVYYFKKMLRSVQKLLNLFYIKKVVLRRDQLGTLKLKKYWKMETLLLLINTQYFI